MKTIVIVLLAVALTWYVTSFGLPPALIPDTTATSGGDGGCVAKETPSITAITMEMDVFELINRERQLAGRDNLEWNQYLNELAKGHSFWMSQNDFIHSQAGYTENIFLYAGYGSEEHIAQEPVDGWMESDRHKANLLNHTLASCGIGIAKSEVTTYITYMAD